MIPAPTALWWFIGSVAVSYVAVPLLLRGIRAQAPDVYSQLGEPCFSKLFSRDPDHWKWQFHFLWFVLSGRALKVTQGKVRLLAPIVWLADCSILLSLIGFFGR